MLIPNKAVKIVWRRLVVPDKAVKPEFDTCFFEFARYQ